MSAPSRRAGPNVVDSSAWLAYFADATLALASAKARVEHTLPQPDSIVYATAHAVGGVVWTQDEDFDGLPGVAYFPRPSGKS